LFAQKLQSHGDNNKNKSFKNSCTEYSTGRRRMHLTNGARRLETSPWAFVVEENPVTSIHCVRLTIVYHYPISIQLGHTYNPYHTHDASASLCWPDWSCSQ